MTENNTGEFFISLQRAQEEQKERYDAKHNTKTNLKVGDEVLVKNMKNTHRMGGKLDIRWTGPYEVVKDCGKMLYKLKFKKTGIALKQAVHCSRLKHYIHPACEVSQVSLDSIKSNFSRQDLIIKNLICSSGPG